MMKKERLLYLDFIRAIAVLTIILTHYNAVFLYLPTPLPEKYIFSIKIFNIYTGNFGVSLFFIISGAALMHSYGKAFEWREYFKKRLVAVYPMWWLSYICVLSYWFLRYKTYNPWQVGNHEGWKILLSVIGFDRYFEGITPVFGFVGEWFLGCIILLYCLFPLLRVVVLDIKRHTVAVLFLLFLYLVGIYGNFAPLHSSILAWVRIPEFIFGMIFVKYLQKKKLSLWQVLSVMILLLNSVIKPGIHECIQTTYVGIAGFMVLFWIADKVKTLGLIQLVSEKLTKYCYPIFLIHHVIIKEIMKGFDLAGLSKTSNLLLFFVIFEIIIVLSILLDVLNRKILQGIKMHG